MNCAPGIHGPITRIEGLNQGDHRSDAVGVLVVIDAPQIGPHGKQLEKLEDVLSVRRHGAEHEVFERLEEFFR